MGAHPHEVKSPSEPRCGGFIEARGTSAQTCAGGRGWSGRSGSPSFPAMEKQVAVCGGHFVGARQGPRHCRRRRDPSAPVRPGPPLPHVKRWRLCGESQGLSRFRNNGAVVVVRLNFLGLLCEGWRQCVHVKEVFLVLGIGV